MKLKSDPLFPRNPARRMGRRVMRPEQVPARHVEIAVIDEPTVLPEELVAAGAVSPVVLVPGHRRLVVVHRMEVVEEEQGSENPGTLDDRRPLASAGPRPMFAERADQEHGDPRDDHREAIDPNGHPADEGDPEHDGNTPNEMLQPDSAQAPLIARDADPL